MAAIMATVVKTHISSPFMAQQCYSLYDKIVARKVGMPKGSNVFVTNIFQIVKALKHTIFTE